MKKIMIIEDNELHSHLIKTLLKGINADILAFSSAVDAIEWLKNDMIDIAIVDIQLPLLNGVEFLEIIRKNESTRNIKCFAVTAQSKFKNMTFKELGFDGYFTKPINIKFFVETINESI
jgi:ribose transport system substrate-binding protein